MSSAPPSATRAMTSPVAGLMVSKKRPEADLTRRPPIQNNSAGAEGALEIAGMSASLEVVRGDAAVGDESGAVGPRGLVGGEIQSEVDDVGRLAETAHGDAVEPLGLLLRLLEQPVHEQRRLDRPRADRVAAHALGA